MSVEAMSLVLNHSKASGTAKLVLIGIANHEGDGGAWPSIATLARYANTSERSVQRAIGQLVELGEVVVHANAGGTHSTPNDRRPNRYDIRIRPVDNTDNGVTQMSPGDVDGVTLVTGRGDACVVNGVTLVSPEPSLNHPEPPAAAARGRELINVLDLPDELQRLRAEFSTRSRIKHVRFTRINRDTAAQLVELVHRHGASALAEHAALTQHQATTVQAFIADWHAVAIPASASNAEPRCADCGRTERSCRAAEAKVADPEDRHEFRRAS